MSAKVRPYRRGGWEVDVVLRLPNGSRWRERSKAPVSSKSAAVRWGEDRQRHLLQAWSAPTEEGGAHTRRIQSILQHHLIPLLGSKKLDAITTEEVQRLKHHLHERAPKTVNNVITVLNVLLKKALQWDAIDRLACVIRLLPIPKPSAGFYDFDEIERLIQAAASLDRATQLIVLLGGDAGLRCGEMMALEWRDIDLRKRQLCVQRCDWKGQVTVPKGGRLRYVPPTIRLATALREHRHLRSERVLCRVDGSPSHLAMRGAPARAIQELAGHQDLSTTQRYMHLSPAALEGAIRLLDQPNPAAVRGDMVETANGESAISNP